VAHSLEDWELLAYAITFSTFESNRVWDWDTMSFVEQDF